jgi:UDP-glucose 4-epimerase
MRAVIIGGAGFLGSHIIERLVRDNIEVVCVDMPGCNTSFLNQIGVPVRYGDITEKESLKPHIQQGDWVFHIAAILGAANANWKVYEKVNVNGTRNALDAAVEKGARSFLFMSTYGVYGPQGSLEHPLQEDMTPNPYSYYDRSKYLGEQSIETKVRRGDINGIILRAPVIFGPRANPKSGTGILFRFLKRGIFAIFGNAKQKFSVCYVKNLANAFAHFAIQHHEGFHLYNLANQPVNTFEDFLGEIGVYYRFKILKLPASLGLILANGSDLLSKHTGIKHLVPKDAVLGMTSHAYNSSIAKAISAGYVQEYSIGQGVKETVEYYEKADGR